MPRPGAPIRHGGNRAFYRRLGASGARPEGRAFFVFIVTVTLPGKCSDAKPPATPGSSPGSSPHADLGPSCAVGEGIEDVGRAGHQGRRPQRHPPRCDAARAREAAIDRLPNFMERLDSPRPDVADDARQMRTEIERKRVPIP